MEDQRRQILADVAQGRLSPEEADRRLAEIDSQPASDTVVAATTQARLTAVRITGQAGSLLIVGDPSVREAVAEGDHSARRDGGVLIIEARQDDAGFRFGNWGFQAERGARRLAVRMNPDLPLEASVQAGSVKIEGVHGPIKADIQAGSALLDGFEGPIEITVQAGSVKADGVLAGGNSWIRSEAGSVKLNLRHGSSVVVDVDSTMGSVTVPGGHGGHAVVGEGAGRLRIDSTMGTVRVTADG